MITLKLSTTLAVAAERRGPPLAIGHFFFARPFGRFTRTAVLWYFPARLVSRPKFCALACSPIFLTSRAVKRERQADKVHLNKRIMVTGGCGFLGSHLCENLIQAGHEVLCVDNCFTGTKRNIAPLLDHVDFEFLRHDITFPLYVEVDQIYNLACPASPIYYQFDPVQTTKTSVHGAINMLGLAKRVKAKILQASSSEVYGDPDVHPQPESYWGRVNPIGLRACYDEGKRCAETLFFDYYRQHGLRIKIARIFNTYGPRMHPNDGRVVSNFIVQALRGRPLTIYGDGSQTRSFCYIDDMVDALVRLMNSRDALTGPINLGNPTETTILQLAETIIALSASPSTVVFKKLPHDDPKQRKPDITLAHKELDWEPVIPLETGLKRTIAYFDQLLKTTGAGQDVAV
jgi:UDP-glucuronate decarboxylase